MPQPKSASRSALSALSSALLASLCLAGCAATADTTGAAGGNASEEPVGQQQEAWDSQDGNPTHATHSYLTEYAIDQLKAQYPELQTYRAQIVDGANRELHELPITSGGTTYGTLAEQEALRVEAVGTNWACNHPEYMWGHAKAAYKAGNKSKAWWYTGIVLHWVEDMGVPAHAFHVIHQGTLTQKDNFELLGLQNWAPTFSINAANPGYASPADYMQWDGNWAASDFYATWPGVTYTRTFFSSSWLWASSKEGNFVKAREGRTATAATWALQSAVTHIALP